MLRYRTQGALAVGLGFLATGCLSEPDLKTSLRPEGPPEILAILDDHEEAAFCKYVSGTLDEKGPGFVQGVTICPTAESDFEPVSLFPLGWSIRIVFDELLNGDAVEELICETDPTEPFVCDGTIANTRPVTVTCGGVAVDYDGYYYPNGNKESFPVGPAIVVFPDPADFTFPTGSTCTVAINDVVVDKQGERVASTANSFDVMVQELDVFTTDPADAEAVEDRTVLAPTGAVTFFFNANLEAASVDATDLEVVDMAGNPVAVDFALVGGNGETDGIEITPTAAGGYAPGQYTARLTSGAMFAEVNGGMVTLAADVDVRFVVE